MGQRAIRSSVLCLALTATVGVSIPFAFGKDEPAAKPATPKADAPKPDPAAEMEAFMKMNQPGPEHKKLASFAGEWEATTTMFMPDGSKMESKGKEKCTAVLGGRFMASEFEGTMMGMPYSGRGLMGYDAMKKKYVMTWSDSMSTSITMFEGTVEGKVMTMVAEQKDAAGHVEKMKTVTTMVDDNHHTFDMYMVTPDGKDMKQMTIVYKRVK